MHLDRAADFRISREPIREGASSVYKWSEALRKKFTTQSRYGDEILLYREIGEDRIGLPRAVCPHAPIDDRVDGWEYEFDGSAIPKNDEQLRIISEAGDLVLQDESFIIQAPTGFGKTVIGAELIAWRDRSACVIVTKEDIADQWRESFREFLNLDNDQIGTWQADKMPKVNQPVAIAMLQSVYKEGRYPSSLYRSFGTVIFDEVHRLGADEFSQAVWKFPARVRIGLSATPQRKDGKDVIFHAHIGPVRVVSEEVPMIPKVLVLKTEWKKPWRERKNGDTYFVEPTPGKTTWVDRVLAHDAARNDLIVRTIKRMHAKERNLVVFCETKKHLEALHKRCLNQGIPFKDIGYYIGGLDKQDLEKAKVKPIALATYKMAGEGTNVPWWDACILCTPKSDVEQIIGRVVREYPDKKTPIIVDMWDSHSKVYTRYHHRRVALYTDMGAEVKLVNVV